MKPIALYIHWPFCKAKCPYCDFNSHVREQINSQQWLEAYIKEFRYFAEKLGDREVQSVFLGGGTPSLMPPELLRALLETMHKEWHFADDIEITLEANPTSTERDKLQAFKEAGVNRVSLGVQALNQRDLQFLGREHSAQEALEAVSWASELFGNYSFDLIYARPEQTLQAWQEELSRALHYVGPHFSLYQLTIEKGTPFYKLHQEGVFTLPPEEEAAEMYEVTNALLAAHSLHAYEVSNYAKPGFKSKHNMAYWRYQEYLGLGPGAHSRIDLPEGRTALMQRHHPEGWLEAVSKAGQAIQQQEPLDKTTMLQEMLMMGLRTSEGVSLKAVNTLLGEEIAVLIPPSRTAPLQEAGLLDCNTDYLRTTDQGRLVLNAVIEKLVA